MKTQEQCAAKTRKGHRCSRRCRFSYQFTSMLAYKFCAQHFKIVKREGLVADER
jgi:hypothetical protein